MALITVAPTGFPKFILPLKLNQIMPLTQAHTPNSSSSGPSPLARGAVDNSANLLRNLVLHCRATQDAAADLGALPLLVQLLGHVSTDTVEAACSAMACLTHRNPPLQAQAVALGALPLLHRLQKHSVAGVRLEAARALAIVRPNAASRGGVSAWARRGFAKYVLMAGASAAAAAWLALNKVRQPVQHSAVRFVVRPSKRTGMSSGQRQPDNNALAHSSQHRTELQFA